MKFHIHYILFLSFATFGANAQKIELQEALDFAVENNLKVKASDASLAYSKALVSTAKVVPKTNVELQYGNIQIPNVPDYAFTVMQPFENPKLNKAREKLFESYVNQSFTASQIKILETKRAVRQAYYEAAYISLLLTELTERDSLHMKALQRAEVRYTAGETTILERTSLVSKREGLLNQINTVKYDLEKSKNELRRILQWQNEKLLVNTSELKKELLVENLGYEGPLFESYERLYEINQAESNLTAASLKPDFIAGITNQSMDRSFRQFVLIGGVNIPIFQKAEKNKIAAYTIQKNAIQAEEIAFQNEVLGAFNTLATQLRATNKELDYLLEIALPNAELIINTAQKQYLLGAINYLEYQQNFSNAFELKEQYLRKLLEQKNIQSELYYLLGK